MFETHSRIVFRSGTGARRPSLKCLRNALWVAITDSLFWKNLSTTKPRCSPDQPMALSENGKTTANQRDPSHHCTPSTARAVTPPDVGVISAAPCIYLFLTNWRTVLIAKIIFFSIEWWDDLVIREWWTGKDVEGSCHILIVAYPKKGGGGELLCGKKGKCSSNIIFWYVTS